jgi:hypothetical protein
MLSSVSIDKETWRAERSYRVAGMWRESMQIFLVVLGSDAYDCQERLPEALAGYSEEELAEIDSFWIERLEAIGPRGTLRWAPQKLLRKKSVLHYVRARRRSA